MLLVVLVSVVVGLIMVVVFRYTSDQSAIRVAKDRLNAHLLAVRLFQDQPVLVLKAYAGILCGTGRYLRLALLPLLYSIVPLIFLMAQVDKYLGSTPLPTGEPFLVTVQAADPSALEGIQLQLPSGLKATAPAVHIPAGSEIAWRVVAEKNANYEIHVAAAGQTFSKQTLVSPGLAQISRLRLRGHFWERMFLSTEPALPQESPIQSIAVTYPARTLSFAWLEWNWIWLFFVLSLAAGFFFKSVLGVEI
jgi:hypothetical protein